MTYPEGPGPIPISACSRHEEANLVLSAKTLYIILSDLSKTPDPVSEHALDVAKSEAITDLCNFIT
jgi:hypothetical protein